MSGCDENGLAKLEFKESIEPKVFYHYKAPTDNEFGDQPLVPDELAMEYLEVRSINNQVVNDLENLLQSCGNEIEQGPIYVVKWLFSGWNNMR